MVTFSSSPWSWKDGLWKEKEESPRKLRIRILGYAFNDFRKDVRPIVLRLERDVDDGGDAGAQNLGDRRK